MAGNFILCNGEVESSVVLLFLDMAIDVDPGKSDLPCHVS